MLRNSGLSCLLAPYRLVSCLILHCCRLMRRFRHPALVRRPHTGKLEQQIAVSSYFVFGHSSICEDANKNIERIVRECPTINGKRCRARRVVKQNIWEQCPGYTLRLSRCISTCVLQSVREGSKKTLIVGRFTSEVGISFFDKDDRLRRPGSALYLDPAAAIA